MTMDQSYLPPMPTLDLTLEQEFKLRKMGTLLDQLSQADTKELLISVQRQNFILTNNLSQLLKAWMTTSHQAITPEGK